MASAAASREAWKTALWWGPILWTIHDCLASVHWVQRWAVDPRPGEAPPEGGELVVAERLSPRLYKFTRGEVVLMRSPNDPSVTLIRRLIGMEGDWVAIPGEARIEKLPKGRCWVEGEREGAGGDSRTFGAVPLALIQGRISYVCWPPSRAGAVPARLPPGRVIAMGSFAAGGAEDDDVW